MGFDYSAQSVIGLKVNADDFYGPVRKVKAFEHDYPETYKVDPKTGKRLWEEEQDWIPGVEGDEEDGLAECRFFGYSFVETRDDLFLVLISERFGGSGELGMKRTHIPSDLMSQIVHFRSMIEPTGLWKDENFGLWTILDGG